jgi:hypothetical protein
MFNMSWSFWSWSLEVTTRVEAKKIAFGHFWMCWGVAKCKKKTLGLQLLALKVGGWTHFCVFGLSWIPQATMMLASEQVSLLTWAIKNIQKYFMPFHGIFWVYSFSMWQISSDMGKYSMTCHQIFCHITKVFFGINKGLLTLNVGLANKTLKCSFMWGLEDKRN